MTHNFTYDVFLSHNSKDKPRVRKLAERLKQAGLRVWFDEWIIKPGDDIYLAIERGLEAARVQVLCLSPAALGSDWVTLERSTVLFRDPTNQGRRFIPLLLADCDLPDTLRRYKYVDYQKENEVAFAELLTACRPEASELPLIGVPKEHATKIKAPPAKSAERTESLAVLERPLTGHGDWVRTVAVSSDGKSIASSSYTTIKVWDLGTGKCLATLEGHENEVSTLAFTKNADWLLSGSWDTTIKLWDVKAQRLAWTGQTERSVESVLALSNGTKALSASRDGGLRFWDLNTGVVLFELNALINDGGDDWLHVAVSKDELRAVSSHGDRKIRLWDLSNRECIAVLEGHTGSINAIALTPDGRYAVSGSDDYTVKLWDLETKSSSGSFEGHTHFIDDIAVSNIGSTVASAARDGTLRLWDWKLAECVGVIQIGDRFFPTSVTFIPNSSRLVVGTNAGPIHVYHLTGVGSASPAEATRRYVNAKVVLLGEGTVGKTSLAHRLVEDKYVVRDRTHGMNVWRMDLPLPPDATMEREALLWDLAGQEDYRLIHQIFLDETALALLLINPQKDDPFAEAGDWLKALKAAASLPGAAREAARLLIFSQIDVGGMKLGDAKIERFRDQYGFDSWLPTSAKTGENCSDKENDGQPSKLKQLIAASIPWDKLPWTSTPRVLTELKNAVVAMRDERDIRLLRFAELTQRLEQALPNEKFGESDVRTAVTLLANHGLARPLKFGDLVLLQPELLNGYAGAIIRAARANKDEIGSVLEADIYKPNFDFTGVERLKNRPDEELLLRALVQTFLDHSLCIAEDTPQGRQLVFPSQYRREKDIPRDPDIFVSYTFSGEWQTVWTTLVVRLWYSQEFEHKELWRNAAEFASGKGHTLGLKIDNRQGEGTATISLYFDVQVPDELKAIFIEYVHRHLAKFGCEVSRDRRYVCPQCGKPVKDLDAVRKRLDANKDFIYCQGCDEKLPLIDFIEQRLKSDPVARKIMAMDETATRKLDTQALEQILIGHMMATCGEANQIFRLVEMSEHGIDAEVEFKDNDGQPSGKKVYVQLRTWNYFQRTRERDGREISYVKDDRHLEYWVNQPVDVYLVARQTDEATGRQNIGWMNVTNYLKNRSDQGRPLIIFEGEKLDMEAVWKVRDQFFPPKAQS